MCLGCEVRATLADFIKSVDEDFDNEDLNLVLEMLRDCNKIQLACPLNLPRIACALVHFRG